MNKTTSDQTLRSHKIVMISNVAIRKSHFDPFEQHQAKCPAGISRTVGIDDPVYAPTMHFGKKTGDSQEKYILYDTHLYY
jgi:hypothetical protein